ncbi:hypothetical protein LTR36_006769 [Oleoguttula mirabilis]|uniref:DUF7962 domain-containing protein n=1 Tax=Oleoguttula mirabilis TaxID=1507867 RepID=A0AAV9JBJ6_9PEZI|nr:hypothetical protein LTR36_006769 [Oleoguttula mirabilis]
MAVGRDVYVDTRMILRRLEELFPPSEAHPALSSMETAGLAALLNKFTIDASVFTRAVQMMPSHLPSMNDESFVKDRAGFSGKGSTLHGGLKRRPETIAHMRHLFDIAESLFADGRDWVGGTEAVSFADLEGVWSFDWIISDLEPPAEYFSEALYPRVYSWRNRFKAALDNARARAPKPVSLKGSAAVQAILGADFSDEGPPTVDPNDPLKLQEGAVVQLFPMDGGGFTHKDRGRLVKLGKDEVAIAVLAKTGEEVRIHAPRWQFRIQEVSAGPRL